MATQFNEKGYTITVYTGGNPMESWLLLHNELLRILSAWDAENDIMETPTHILSLLEDMMPEWETAKKMLPGKKE